MKTYDPKQVLIALGPHIVTGYADGTFISIEPHGDGIVKKVGGDGEVVRTINPDDTATVTITVLQSSPTVAYCQAQHDKDRATGDGTFPVLIKDMKGGLIFDAQDGWVTNSPTREFGMEDANREIEIATGRATWEGEATA
jgi:hypothetical protein